MYLTVDFTMKLPSVARKDIILVICDQLLKMVYLVTIIEGIQVEGLVR